MADRNVNRIFEDICEMLDYIKKFLFIIIKIVKE